MENIQMRIRIGSAHNGRDGVYHNATFAEALEALRGTQDEDGEIRAQYVYVVGTYVQGFTEDLGSKSRPRPVERKADQPVFGLEVTIYPPRTNYWTRPRSQYPAEINWSALGSSSPDVARFYAHLMTVASNLADTVNAGL